MTLILSSWLVMKQAVHLGRLAESVFCRKAESSGLYALECLSSCSSNSTQILRAKQVLETWNQVSASRSIFSMCFTSLGRPLPRGWELAWAGLDKSGTSLWRARLALIESRLLSSFKASDRASLR